MHWVYILQCGEKNNKIYIGETKRLYTRFKEHCKKNTGSVTTHFFYPNQIIGLYKLENATKTSALDLEIPSPKCICNIWDLNGKMYLEVNIM